MILFIIIIYIVESNNLKIEETIKTPDIINQNKFELKNGEEVNLRYFHSSDSVFVSRSTKNDFEDLLYITDKIKDKCKFM